MAKASVIALILIIISALSMWIMKKINYFLDRRPSHAWNENKVLTAISHHIITDSLILVIITSFNTESSISLPIKRFHFNWYANIFQQLRISKNQV